MSAEPCSRCVAEMQYASALLRIEFAGVIDQGRLMKLDNLTRSGRLADRVAMLREAIAERWPITLNNMPDSVVPVTTWHGDPICAGHLWTAYRDANSPQTVRMAHWAPGRPR